MAYDLLAAFAILLLTLIIGFVALVTFNAIVALRQRIDRAWANIDVVLRQRHDELPSVVAAVRDVMAYEQGVIEEVSRLRAAYRPDDSIDRQAVTSEATSAAVRQLFAVAERYPDLKSHTNVLALQAEIERIEGVISDRRELYNDTVYRYNTRIGQVPAVFLAWLLGWTPRAMFRAGPDDVARPEVGLRPA